MLQSKGVAATGSASRYISQLCKHWSHKFEVSFDADRGDIALPLGRCRLEAEPEALKVTVEAADAADLTRLEQVVATHLARFSFREPLDLAWVRPAAA